MEIGKFQEKSYGYTGSIGTLALQLNPVLMKRRDKGADYGIYGPDDCELGAAWRRIEIVATNPDLLGVVLFCVVGLGLTINVLLRHPDFILMSEQLQMLP